MSAARSSKFRDGMKATITRDLDDGMEAFVRRLESNVALEELGLRVR